MAEGLPPGGAPGVPNSAAVSEWMSRIDDVSQAIEEVMKTDPEELERRREERRKQHEESEKEAARQKVKDRYDPRKYTRFENDELIKKMLEECDKPLARKETTQPSLSDLSTHERVALREAEACKEGGNKAFKEGNYTRAKELYANAIELKPLNHDLIMASHNNKAQVNILLQNFIEAVADASYVLTHDQHNIKALLRRATSLAKLHRPKDALVDIEKLLRIEPRHVEALKLNTTVRKELKEFIEYERYEDVHPEAASELSEQIKALVQKCESCQEVMSSSLRSSPKKLKGGEDSEAQGNTTTDQAAVDVEDKDKVVAVAASEEDVEAVLKDLLVAVCTSATHVVDPGSAVLFRIKDGLSNSIRIAAFLVSILEGDDDGSGAGTVYKKRHETALTTVVASILRLLSAAHCTTVARSLFADAVLSSIASSTPAAAGRYAPQVFQFAVKRMSEWFSVKNLSRGGGDLLSACCIQFLESSTAESEGLCNKVVASLSSERLEVALREWSTDSSELLFTMKLLGNALLCYPSPLKKYAISSKLVEATTRCLRAVKNSKKFVLAEASIMVALRLSSHKECLTGMIQQVAIQSFCWPLAMTQLDAAPQGEFIREGSFAVLYNLLVQAGDQRSTVVQSIDMSVFAKGMAIVGKTVDKRDVRLLNVSSRALGLISKACGVSDEVAKLALTHAKTTVWESLIVPQAGKGWTQSLSGSMAALTTSSMDEVSAAYLRQLQQHASLILALLILTKKSLAVTDIFCSTKHFNSVLSECIKPVEGGVSDGDPVMIGNIALILAEIPKEGPFMDMAAEAGTPLTLLEALKQLRVRIQALESGGEKGTPTWQHHKSAQKNVSVAMSRMCVHPAMLQQLRDNKGIEILAATMERNPDGTLK